MTTAQIRAALKGATDPVILRELADEDDHAAILAQFQRAAPKNIAIYPRHKGISRDRTTCPHTLDLTPAAIMGRVRVK